MTLPSWFPALLVSFAVFLADGSGALLAAPKADMTKPPAVGPVKPYAAPPRAEYKLANGLEVLLVEDRRFPLVSARLAVRRGSAALKRKEAGTMDALAELLTEGTRAKSAKEIAEEADAIGGEIEASAGHDFLVARCSALSEHFGRMLDLLREVALEPSFPPGEVDLRKKNMLEELKVNRSQARFLAGVAFYKKLYGGHPYAVTAPTEKSIGRIDRQRLVELHRESFLPKLSILVVVGDFSASEARAAIEKRFGPWARRDPTKPGKEDPPEAEPRRVYLLDRPGSSQTEFRLGNLAITERHPDYFKLLVLNGVLGGSFASRLVSDIREKRGFAYRIGTRVASLKELGSFTLSTQVRTDVTGEALKAILEHLENIRKEAVTQEELDSAKNVLAGRFVRQMETQDGVADQFLHLKLYDLPRDHLETYVQKVQAVTREKALEAARAHIQPDQLVIAVVGDASKIGKTLLSFSRKSMRRVNPDGD